MGKTFSTGLLTNGIWQDSSNNIGIGAAANASFKLQVTGATNLTGALSGTNATFSDFLLLSKNANSGTIIDASNTTAGNSSQVTFRATSDTTSGYATFGKFSSSTSAYKIIGSSNAFLYTDKGDIAILNDNASGAIKIAAGASSTAHLTISSTGAATFSSSITSTAAPNALLHQFNGRSADNLGQILFYSNDASALYSFITAGSSEFILGTVTNIPLNFYAGNAERMRIRPEFALAAATGGFNGPTQIIGTTSMCGILFVSIGTQNCAAIFIINAASPPVLVSQTSVDVRFSNVANSGNTCNVYVSGSNLILQNNIQADRTFFVQYQGKT
jgi:hypothetical protein